MTEIGYSGKEIEQIREAEQLTELENLIHRLKIHNNQLIKQNKMYQDEIDRLTNIIAEYEEKMKEPTYKMCKCGHYFLIHSIDYYCKAKGCTCTDFTEEKNGV